MCEFPQSRTGAGVILSNRERENIMSLPQRYGTRIRNALGVRAVWMPGDPVTLGQILVKNGDRYFPHDDLSSFNATLKTAVHQDKSLDLASSGTKQTLIQAGVELPSTAKLDLTAEASVKLEFKSKFEYLLKTPTLRGSHITNMNQVAQAVFNKPGWRHANFYIVHEVYEANEWTFLGTETRGSTIEISGKGAGILSFLTAGASVGISVTGQTDVKMIGKGGAIGMGLVRVRKDGTTDHD
jgi:hypothetical protein